MTSVYREGPPSCPGCRAPIPDASKAFYTKAGELVCRACHAREQGDEAQQRIANAGGVAGPQNLQARGAARWLHGFGVSGARGVFNVVSGVICFVAGVAVERGLLVVLGLVVGGIGGYRIYTATRRASSSR